ncbi:MAG: cytochrome c biogenesis protein CcsA [bacterium]|nr:cytochrome c biogenesis protein CcsA [bacterium]
MIFWHHLVPVLLVPAGVLPFLGRFEKGLYFWCAFGMAALAATAWTAAQFSDSWSTGFGPAIWLTVSACLLLFLVLSLLVPEFWRLGAILGPWILVMAVLALAWNQAEATRSPGIDSVSDWIGLHVILSVTTYVFLTMAAIAGFAVILQERSLKRRTPGRLTPLLPSLADCERLEFRLLVTSEIILAAGIATGLAATSSADAITGMNHKIVFTAAAFAVIAMLLVARQLWGTRGRRAARLVLTGYLLMTLAYPGVKFVTDVVIG